MLFKTRLQSNMIKHLALFFLVLVVFSCKTKEKEIVFPKTDLAINAIIPKPLEVTATNSGFALDKHTAIVTKNSDEFKKVGEFLSKKIDAKTGLNVNVNSDNKETRRVIYINQKADLANESPEAYQIKVGKDSIILNAKTAAGAFLGAQTIRQIIPETSNDTIAPQPIWVVPTGTINDAPNFKHRGVMLDVSRHFFNLDEVKRFIDLLAYYKYNSLQLHLSDDQGWRIEIKKWPKLTEIGARTEVGGGPGGFYTQEQFKELVQYAADHHMAIVPCIDMPGHTNAATYSYPFLNGLDKPAKEYTGTNVGFSTLDTRKDSTYMFLDDVIGEISKISPSPYFHIAGDESHVTKKEDFIYFIERVEKIVNKHGKIMMGYDELVQADIKPETVIQYWHDEVGKNSPKMIEGNYPVILSPPKKIYLDMKYDTLSKHGLHWAAYIPVDTAYIWTPETYVKGLPRKNIVGLEAKLWSETVSNSAEIEYLTFPRAIGYAELAWSPETHRNWEEYKTRLVKHVPYLNRNNVNYYKSKKIDWDSYKD